MHTFYATCLFLLSSRSSTMPFGGDMLCAIFSFLGVPQRLVHRRVCRRWRRCLEANKTLWENYTTFVSYQKEVRQMITPNPYNGQNFLTGNVQLQRQLCMTAILTMSTDQRYTALGYMHHKDLEGRKLLLTDEGVVVLVVGLLTRQQIFQMPLHILPFLVAHSCITAVQNGFLTPKQVMAMPKKGYVPHTPTNDGIAILHVHLWQRSNRNYFHPSEATWKSILTDNERSVRDSLQLSDLLDIEYLWYLLHEEEHDVNLTQTDTVPTSARWTEYLMWKDCIVAVQEGLLTTDQLAGHICVSTVRAMYDREITTARDRRLTVQRICNIPSVMGLTHLLSAPGIPGITGIIPSRPFLDLKCVGDLGNLMCPEGFVALREGLLTIQDVIDESELAYLACVDGNTALREGLLTIPQACKLAQCVLGAPDSGFGNLGNIVGYGGLAALCEGWLNIQQMIELADAETGALFALLHTKNGKKAIREDLLTLQQAIDISRISFRLVFLLQDNGITALREGLYTPQQIIDIPDVEHLAKLLSDEGIEARRETILSLKDTSGSRKRLRSASP